MTVTIPANSNNESGSGTFTCTQPGGNNRLDCGGALDDAESTDDVFLSTIRFGPSNNRVTFNGNNGEIITGMASVYLEGGGGTNVNAEWGDNDDNDDGDHNPFVKAGYAGFDQEDTDIDVINATLLQVFRTLNIMEGVDGEDENFLLELIFERGVRDNNGGALDAIPEIIIFERGLNSDVTVQLLLADGGVSNGLSIARADFRDSGISADTIEIAGEQPMGVVGVDLNSFSGAGFDPASDTVIGVRFGSAGGGADIFGVFGTTKDPQPLRDWGDAPESYGTLNADDGPNHLLSRDLFIGFPPDSEPNGQPSADATGDDPIASEDEALGYQFPSGPFLPGDTFSVTVPVFNQTGASALLCGWLDFNQNGTFENADATSGANTDAERICTTVADESVSTGTNPDTVTLDFTIPSDFAGAPAGGLFARFRITSAWAGSGAASPLGGATNGEVEDVLFDVETTNFDYGDLPDDDSESYGTLRSSNGARHIIVFGLRLGDAVDAEADGQPDGGLANGDDLTGVNDEDGVIFPDALDSNMAYTTTVTATNTSASDAMLCAWFDFADDGVLDNTPNTSTANADPESGSAVDSGERSCVLVPAATSDGTFQISWTIPESARDNTGLLPLRYRLSTDSAMFVSSTLAPVGSYTGGEVEDYLVDFEPGTLPVSIASFASRYTGEGLELAWSTVSETHNLGFQIWGDKGAGLEQLSADLIPALDGDAVTPRHYTLMLPGLIQGDVLDLAVTAVDYDGDEDVYGLFEVGTDYGQDFTLAPINWEKVRLQAEQLSTRSQSESVNTLGGSTLAAVDRVDIRVSEPGLQEVTWQMLADAGMDLTGVAPENIAVTLKGAPIARHVLTAEPTGGAAVFGPGASIRFWGDTPALPDALYLQSYTYQITQAPALARPAESLVGAWTRFDDSFESTTIASITGAHLEWQRIDSDVFYNFASPLADPWYAAQLRADRNSSHDTMVELDVAVLTDKPGQIKVRLGGLTEFPATPDHHAVIEVNGTILGEAFFDGRQVHEFDLTIPRGVLSPGTNIVTVRAPGGTAAPFDLFLLDSIELGYPRLMRADGNRLHVESHPAGSTLEAGGFSPGPVTAYARANGELYRLDAQLTGAGQVSIVALDQEADYWISGSPAGSSGMVSPAAVEAVAAQDLLDGVQADFLVIAHPAFLPASDTEPHPLNDYLAVRKAEGWDVAVFDITAVQSAYGWGMPLPAAVTTFLQAAETRVDYEHVLLVGGDSYDYTDNLGMGSISFIPTRYAATSIIPHTPSDALLADLDGDGVSDKAIGRWPVRTRGDLESIVAKTLAWPSIANPESAVWVTDSEDSRSGSFREQAERMLAPLAQAGWNEFDLDRVYFSEVVERPGMSLAASARTTFFEQLALGRALTGFVGHGAAGMWTFQGLLRPNDLKDLYNEGNPTLVGTLTCYTSYFVSPNSDTVAHRWMNGYRENADGGRIEGVANGAVAVHGAATLSSYGQNEIFARTVQDHQLAGHTLGNAIQAARHEADRRGMNDQVLNWTLLGDPTLKLGASN